MFTGRVSLRGTTLVEALLCGGLSLLILGLLHGLLRSAQAYQDHARARSSLQVGLLKTIRQIGQALVESNRFAIAAEPTEQSLIFSTPRDALGQVRFDSQGRLIWMRMLCLRLDANAGLISYALALDPPAVDPPPPLSITEFLSRSPARVISPTITRFSPELTSDGTVTYWLKAQLRQSLHTYAIEMEEKVLPRN